MQLDLLIDALCFLFVCGRATLDQRLRGETVPSLLHCALHVMIEAESNSLAIAAVYQSLLES